MTFDINSFRSEIQQQGYVKPHDYNVIVYTPPILLGRTLFGSGPGRSTSDIAPMLSMRVNECRSPIMTMICSDVNRYSIGPTQKQPHNAQFQDMWLSIICDKYGIIWNFWHTWLNAVFSFAPPYNAPGGGAINGEASYTTEYKSNYSTNMQLNIYNQTGGTVLQFLMSMAFPIQMREVSLAWPAEGELVMLNIALSYKDYTIIGSGLSTSGTGSSSVSPIPTTDPSLTPILTTI